MHIILLVAVALIAGAEPAHAGFIGAAFGAVVSWFSTGSILAVAATRIVASLGLSLLSRALAGDPASKRPAIRLEVEMGDAVPMSFPVGKAVVPGHRQYIGTWGRNGQTTNAFLVDVLQLSSIPLSGISRVWVNDEPCEILWDYWGKAAPGGAGQWWPEGYDTMLDMMDPSDEPDAALGYPVSGHIVKGKPRVYVKFYDGTQTAADPYLVERFGDHEEHPWGEDMVGYGCAYAIITVLFHAEKMSSLPSMPIEPAPTAFYDLRLDSTNGGSGPHRWNDPSTWAPTENPAVIAYNLIRGVYWGDEWVYGGANLAANRLPASSWIAAANACDEVITNADETTEPAYRCGLEVTVDVEPLTMIEEIMKAANMRIAEVGGVFKALVGAPGSAVYDFTDDDVLITEGQSFAPFQSLDQTYNAVIATYPEPDEKWASKDAPEYVDATATAEDGERYLPVSMSFPAAPFALQVQRLQRAVLQDHRRMRVHQISLPPEAYPLEPNDVVSWTSARNGYVNKKFLVTSITKRPTFSVAVSLREIDPADYDWSSDYEVPVAPVAPGAGDYPAQAIGGWAAAGEVVTDDLGRDRIPAIRVSCDADIDGVSHVRVQLRVAGQTALVTDTDALPYDEPYSWVVKGLSPDTAYEARGIFVSDMLADQEWSAWVPVTTPDVRIGAIDLADEINTAIADGAAAAAAAASAAAAAIAAAATVQGNLDAAVADLQADDATLSASIVSLSSSLTTETTNRIAAVNDEALARANADSAMAAQISTTSASLGSLTATVSTQAVAISDLQDGASAGYLIEAQAGGSVSLLSLIAADGSGGTPVSVAKISATDILLDGSVAASQLVVTDLSGNLFGNGDFAAGDLRGWETFGAMRGATVVDGPSVGSTAEYVLQIPDMFSVVVGSGHSMRRAPVVVVPGERFAISGSLYASWASAAIYLGARWYDASGAYLSSASVPVEWIGPRAWAEVSGVITAPAGAAYARFAISRTKYGSYDGSGAVYLANAQAIRQRPGAVLITPSSITGAQLIASEAIITNSAQMGTAVVTNGAVVSGGLNADRLNTASMSVAGLSVFGGALQSSNYSAGSAGWRINNNGDAELNSLVVRESMIQNGAVSALQTANVASVKVTNAASYQDYLTLTIVATADVKVILGFDYTLARRLSTLLEGRVRLDGVTVDNSEAAADTGTLVRASSTWAHTLAAGTHTLTLQAKYTGARDGTLEKASLFALVAKK